MPEKKTEEVEPDPAFDAKSAEVADVEQQGDAEIQTIGAEEVGKIDDFIGDSLPPPPPDVPASSGIEQRLGDLEKALVKLASKQGEIVESGAALEDKLSNLRAGFDEFEELIAKVGSAQHEVDLRLSEAMSVYVNEHNDRLLHLEMKVSRIYGDEEA